MTAYTIERVRPTPAGNIVFQLVLPDLQRVSVTIPRARATIGSYEPIIEHALANIYRPVKVLGAR